jgi:hypothetical protein
MLEEQDVLKPFLPSEGNNFQDGTERLEKFIDDQQGRVE